MGLFGFLRAKPRETTLAATHVSGRDGRSLAVVGESNYQAALWAIAGAPRGTEVRAQVLVVLVPEPRNSYDRNAVQVLSPESGVLGYLSREDAAVYQPILREHRRVVACDALIAGGGPGDDGRTRQLGIWLDLPEPDDLRGELRRS